MISISSLTDSVSFSQLCIMGLALFGFKPFESVYLVS